MDPDVALFAARAALKVADDAAEGDSNDAEIDALREAVDAYRALDCWISTGGFPPESWASLS